VIVGLVGWMRGIVLVRGRGLFQNRLTKKGAARGYQTCGEAANRRSRKIRRATRIEETRNASRRQEGCGVQAQWRREFR